MIRNSMTHESCMKRKQFFVPLKLHNKIATFGSSSISLSSPPMAPSNLSTDLFFDALASFDQQQQEQEQTSELIKTLDPPSPPSSFRHRRPSRERRSRILQRLQETAVSETPQASSSTLTLETLDSPNQSLLFSVAGFVIKAISFQLNLLIACFSIPVKLLQFSFLMVYDPFGMVKFGRNVVKERFLWVWNWVIERVRNQEGLGKLVVRLGLGCFWSVYVGFVLFGILVSAFLAGSFLMKLIVEEPLEMVRELNFDYMKPSPDAFVALDPRVGGDCGLILDRKDEIRMQVGSRVVSMNHRLQLVVSLTLPESDYNMKLGMFQVRAEFLTATGKVAYRSSQPCMLRFKSPHIRFAETFLKTGILLIGHSSESQTLNLKMTRFIEGNEPTVCVRVVLEQRAEYKPGAGIPEIYAATLKLESRLPLLKRIIWNWRRTVFIWVGLGLLVLELLIALICCSPFIIPRTWLRRGTARRT